MSLGFSVYFGLDNTMEENIYLLINAEKLGFTRIFTSLHIPEANYDKLKVEVSEFFKLAKEKNWPLIDLKDLQSLLKEVYDHASDYSD